MWSPIWLRALRPQPSTIRCRRTWPYSPRLEPLEDRLTPAFLTVNSGLDTNARDDVLTLREGHRQV